ncbi:hypothetical protein CYMTET_13000 [Cymbomonas tetramitiformis]|uniref:Uncharacterized protein n=1 Tax=Cymbomonas tetramitiformis TaxID=36881 RepID=A0AAE0BQC4_9CHLO|nr:hypothetical protein CYMTET_49373 [Cymbomonas tetramitiformis]KAK3279098.1 hypothetical protein CYMTET_13000 [Cymbomonas tetramitiformis]
MPLTPSEYPILTDTGTLDVSRACEFMTAATLGNKEPKLAGFVTAVTAAIQSLYAFRAAELRPEPVETELVERWRSVSTTLHNPDLATVLEANMPEVRGLVEQILTAYFADRRGKLRGAAMRITCPCLEGSDLCGETECTVASLKKPTSTTFGTCGQQHARFKPSTHLARGDVTRGRRNVCGVSQLIEPPACECDMATRSYVHYRCCRFVLHRACAARLYVDSNYAFMPGDKAHILCSRCLLLSPQLIPAILEGMETARGGSIDHLVILPNHARGAEDTYYGRVLEMTLEGPPLAYPGVYDELVTEDVPLHAADSGTPSHTLSQLHPVQQQLQTLREGLLNSIQRTTAVGNPSPATSDTDSQLGDVQQASPFRLLPHALGELRLQHAADPVAPTEEKYVPPGRRTTQAPNKPTHKSDAPAGAIGGATKYPNPFDDQVANPQSAAFQEFLANEATRLQREGPAFKGTPTYDDLVSLQSPDTGMEAYVTGEIDGLTVADPASPSHLGCERFVNYSGNSVTKHSKTQMQRMMFVQTLGESSEFQHTPLQRNVNDLVQDGSSIRVKDNIQFPTFEHFMVWC